MGTYTRVRVKMHKQIFVLNEIMVFHLLMPIIMSVDLHSVIASKFPTKIFQLLQDFILGVSTAAIRPKKL